MQYKKKIKNLVYRILVYAYNRDKYLRSQYSEKCFALASHF